MTANTHDDEYLAICEFYQTVWSLIKENDIWVEQVREEPNPYYNVTTDGLCLEMYYGSRSGPRGVSCGWAEAAPVVGSGKPFRTS